MNVFVFNTGSSSLKFRLIQISSDHGKGESVLARGLVERWGTPTATLKFEATRREAEDHTIPAETPGEAAESALRSCMPMGIDAIGHRVVHGGPDYVQPTLLDAAAIDGIRKVSELAPLHNNLALAAIEATVRLLPQKASVAVFDTAFHRTMPKIAALYAIPLDLAERHHLRRYGFHGISHQYVSRRLLECMNRPAAGSRLITCHLGNGASLCAVRDGMSVDTSMGFTPLEGLVMGSRSGDIDAGLVLHLITALGMTAAKVDELLNHQSGLLGISGRSGDVRDLEQAASQGDARAALAIEMYAYRIRKYIGAYAAAMGGLDAIAFAGGVGEHSSAIRKRICTGLEFLGAHLDESRNGSIPGDQAAALHQAGAAVQLWVVPTNEESQIAREVYRLLADT